MNEKLIRLLCLIGVDPIIMARHYKILHLDRERFISQGIGTIIILLITITSSSLFFYELNYPNLELLNWGNLGNMIFVIFSGVIFVLLTTFIIYMIQRFICIVSNHTRQTFEVPITAYLRQIFLILLALICGAMLALPIQVWLFRVDIDREFLFQSQQKIFNSISFSEESANSRLIPLYQDFYGLGQEPVDVPKRQMIESKISGPDNTRGIRVESSADGPIKPIRITENIDQPKPDVVKKNPDIVPAPDPVPQPIKKIEVVKIDPLLDKGLSTITIANLKPIQCYENILNLNFISIDSGRKMIRECIIQIDNQLSTISSPADEESGDAFKREQIEKKIKSTILNSEKESLSFMMHLLRNPGFVESVTINFKILPVLSWLLITLVALIQLMPALLKAVSSKTSYDYLVREHNKYTLARVAGIQIDGVDIYNQAGKAYKKPIFHQIEQVNSHNASKFKKIREYFSGKRDKAFRDRYESIVKK